jgi:hypothetical protein
VFAHVKTELSDHSVQLEKHRQNLDQRIQSSRLAGGSTSEEQDVERQALHEEINSMKESLAFVDEISSRATESRVKTNVFEDLSLGDDGTQVIVSTKELISAKRITGGARSQQYLGQWEPEALVELTKNPNLASKAIGDRLEEKGGFENRWGAGKKMN